MPANVDMVKSKVQAILTDHGPVQIDRDGDFSFGAGSTRVFVRVLAHPNDEATLISIFAPVLFDVPLTPEFYEYLAKLSDAMVFGHLTLAPGSTDEFGFLLVTHTLLGDYVDDEELLYAVYAVANSADHFDDSLQEQFGGKRFEDT